MQREQRTFAAEWTPLLNIASFQILTVPLKATLKYTSYTKGKQSLAEAVVDRAYLDLLCIIDDHVALPLLR